jgi:O-antigen ligase
MTRGTWGQIFITLTLVVGDLLVRRRLRLRVIFVSSILLLIPVIVVFSITEWRDAAIARFETLLPWNTDSLAPSDSVIVKQVEAQKMVSAIGQRPLFGHGFGYVQVDDALGAIYFHNSYLQITLKTGLLGLGVSAFLFFYAVVNTLGVGRRVKHRFPQNRDILYGLIYGFLGVLVATSSNPHMTTPIFVTMLAFMLAFTELVHRQWRRSQQVNRGKRFDET